jgi:hypothetical protein
MHNGKESARKILQQYSPFFLQNTTHHFKEKLLFFLKNPGFLELISFTLRDVNPVQLD